MGEKGNVDPSAVTENQYVFIRTRESENKMTGFSLKFRRNDDFSVIFKPLT